MSDPINRRQFLLMTGAAGVGLTLAGRKDASRGNLQTDPGQTGTVPDSGGNRNQGGDPTDPARTLISWSAEELWKHSVADGLRYNGEAIVLDDHLLIEEDAPGWALCNPLCGKQ